MELRYNFISGYNPTKVRRLNLTKTTHEPPRRPHPALCPAKDPHDAANFTVALRYACDAPEAPTPPAAVVYHSPPLVGYDYDKCDTWPSCYSPAVVAESGSLDLSADKPLAIELTFHNNLRNAQIHLPINITLTWDSGATATVSVGKKVLAHEHHRHEEDGSHAPWNVQAAV